MRWKEEFTVRIGNDAIWTNGTIIASRQYWGMKFIIAQAPTAGVHIFTVKNCAPVFITLLSFIARWSANGARVTGGTVQSNPTGRIR